MYTVLYREGPLREVLSANSPLLSVYTATLSKDWITANIVPVFELDHLLKITSTKISDYQEDCLL